MCMKRADLFTHSNYNHHRRATTHKNLPESHTKAEITSSALGRKLGLPGTRPVYAIVSLSRTIPPPPYVKFKPESPDTVGEPIAPHIPLIASLSWPIKGSHVASTHCASSLGGKLESMAARSHVTGPFVVAVTQSCQSIVGLVFPYRRVSISRVQSTPRRWRVLRRVCHFARAPSPSPSLPSLTLFLLSPLSLLSPSHLRMVPTR